MKYQFLLAIDGRFERFEANAENDIHARNIAKKALKNRLSKLATSPKEYGYSFNVKIQQKGE